MMRNPRGGIRKQNEMKSLCQKKSKLLNNLIGLRNTMLKSTQLGIDVANILI